MRHNYYYKRYERNSDGQTCTARPKDAGTETHQHSQSTPRSRYRSSVKQNPFFDPRDLLQVRYEMLRRHSTEAMSILDAAAAFGVSRPTFYQAQSAFSRAGLAGLLPGQRGPKGGHKVTPDVLDY